MRGSGLGQELLAKGLLRCRQLHPGADIRISAQAHLRHFYEGFGFAAVGEPYLEDGVPHIEMLRSMRERVELDMPPVV
jgi:ElaA protein